jgi:hypothetical protein
MLTVGLPQLVMNSDIGRSCSVMERFLFAIRPRKTRWAQSVSDRLILGETTFRLAGMNRGWEVVLGKRFCILNRT